MKTLLSIFPAQSIIIFLLCAVGILVFIFMIIIPARSTSAELDAEIEKLNARIEEQRILTPVFKSLIQKTKAENVTGLPVTPKTKLDQGDINQILTYFQDLAKRLDLRIEELAPDVTSLTDNSGHMLVRLTLAGDFRNFRKFLLELGSISSMAHVEDISIRSIEASREIKIKVWFVQG